MILLVLSLMLSKIRRENEFLENVGTLKIRFFGLTFEGPYIFSVLLSSEPFSL